jgi:hypothetical protein
MWLTCGCRSRIWKVRPKKNLPILLSRFLASHFSNFYFMNQKRPMLDEPVVQVGDKISISWPNDSGEYQECRADIISIHQSTKKKDGSLYVYQLLFENGTKKKTRLLNEQYAVIDSIPSHFLDLSRKRSLEEDSLQDTLLDRPSKKSLTEQSKAQYGYGWNRYVKFCAEKGYPLDASGGSISDQMEAFLTYVVIEDPVKTVTPAVANSYVSAIGKTLIEANQLQSMAQIRTPKFTAQLEAYTKAYKFLKAEQMNGQMHDHQHNEIQLQASPEHQGQQPVEHSIIEI